MAGEADRGSLTDLGVGELSVLLMRREVTSRDVVDACLARIDQLGPLLNAHVTVLHEQARRAAGQADRERLAGQDRGPLQGVPLSVKDLFDVAGVPRTAGSRLLRADVPPDDAAVVTRLKEQGAVILAKDNLHEFAFGTTGENPHMGATRNPWDRERISGGSSSGTAAAVSARLVPAGLGTDSGGSVRIPASLCGVTGAKPTFGAISRAGVWPLALSLDHVGVLARTVEDCALVLEALAGPDPRDPATEERAEPVSFRWGERDVRHLRLGRSASTLDAVEPGVAAAVEDALGVLSNLGAHVREVDLLPPLESMQALGLTIMAFEAAAFHRARLESHPEEYGEDVRRRLQGGARTTPAAYQAALRARDALRARFAAAFDTVDLLVGPTVPLVAPPIGSTFAPVGPGGQAPRALLNRFTVPANLAGLPAVTVPCGFAAGLPVGLQLVGPRWRDGLVLQAAAAYQHATDWHARRPPV